MLVFFLFQGSNSESFTCNNISCDGYCYQGYQCISKIQEKICISGILGSFYLIIAFALPNIIFLLLSFVLSNPPPVFSAIGCFIMNLFWALLFQSFQCKSVDEAWMNGLIIIPILIIMCFVALITNVFSSGIQYCCGGEHIPIQEIAEKNKETNELLVKNTKYDDRPLETACCEIECCFEPHDPQAVLREIENPIIDHDLFKNRYQENLSLYPEIRVHTKASCKRKKERDLILYDNTQNIDFGSWQDETCVDPLVEAPFILYQCNPHYVFDEDLTTKIEDIKRCQYDNIKELDGKHICYTVKKIPNFMRYATVSKKNIKTLICTSGFNKVMIRIMMFFGYNYILETVWRCNSISVVQDVVKHCSGDTNLRAKPGERDLESLKNKI